MTTDEKPRVYTAQEAAKILKLCRPSVYKLIQLKQLYAVKVGVAKKGKILIPEYAIANYLGENQNGGETQGR